MWQNAALTEPWATAAWSGGGTKMTYLNFRMHPVHNC